MAAETFKVRPFDEFFETGSDKPMLPFVGKIEDGRFVVSVLGQHVALETVEVGEDKWGTFAMVTERKAPLVDGFICEASVEYEEDEEPGGCISVFIEGKDREAAKKLLAEQGIDPEQATILIARERAFVVHFNFAGVVDGRGTVGGKPATEKMLH